MTNESFVSHQTTLGLNNKQLAEKLGANEGSVSRWRKDMPIPEYIAGYLQLLVAVEQNKLELSLTLEEIVALSKRAEDAGCSFADYIIGLMRKDLKKSEPPTHKIVEIIDHETLHAKVAADGSGTNPKLTQKESKYKAGTPGSAEKKSKGKRSA